MAAASTAQRAPGRSQPICTIRGTPTAVAAAIADGYVDLLAVAGDVEVAVVVDDRVRQAVGERRPRVAHAVSPAPIRSRIAATSGSAAWVGIQWVTPSSTTSS